MRSTVNSSSRISVTLPKRLLRIGWLLSTISGDQGEGSVQGLKRDTRIMTKRRRGMDHGYTHGIIFEAPEYGGTSSTYSAPLRCTTSLSDPSSPRPALPPPRLAPPVQEQTPSLSQHTALKPMSNLSTLVPKSIPALHSHQRSSTVPLPIIPLSEDCSRSIQRVRYTQSTSSSGTRGCHGIKRS